jgi:transposase
MYSKDFREKIFKIQKQNNWTQLQTANFFKIGRDTLRRWKINIEPCHKRKTKNRIIDEQKLKELIEKQPDIYQEEIAEKLGASQSGVCRALQRLGLTYKKNSVSSKSK